MGTMTDARRDRVRAALGTPNFANETSGDFSDLVSTVNRRYVSLANHTRIVAGADDLVHPMAGRGNGGGVARSAPALPDFSGHAVKTDDETGIAPRDMRSVRQIEFIDNLISWITEHNPETGRIAREWTDGMTERGLWTPGRGGNASNWITKLRAKLDEVKAAPKTVAAPACDNCGTNIRPDWCSVCRETAPVAAPANVQHDELPQKTNKNGRPMPMYYAVEMDGVTKFYRVKAGTKPGWWWIEAQASDEFHPVRNVGTKNQILRAIIDQGAEECIRNYGRKINHCGRCHHTLTDATSRANGIGPECEGKM